MRVIIAGSRQFDNYDLLCQKCNEVLISMDNIEVLSGNSKGADQLGEKYAVEKSYSINLFLPEWYKYSKLAGIKRNEKTGANVTTSELVINTHNFLRLVKLAWKHL